MTRALWLLTALAACQAGPPEVPEGADPARFAVAQDPVGGAAWAQAQQCLARGERTAALELLPQVVQRCPDLVRAHLAYQDAARGEGGKALQAMLDHYRVLPERDSPVPGYCKARLAETTYAQGTALQAVVAKYPTFGWGHLSLARVARRKGQLLQAIDGFRAASVRDPGLFEARLERAQVLAEVGRNEEAAVDYEAYLEAVPGDHVARRAFAELAIYRLKRIDRAMQLLDQLEQALPGDLSVRQDRAAAQWLGGDPRLAVATYLTVLAQRPDDARTLLNVGLLYYEVLPKDVAERPLYWPKARAAFRLFLAAAPAQDGHEQFERTLAVPFRLDVIADGIGPAAATAPSLDDLRLPGSG
jgi:tetratricopeptide (TPR) repeat protein